MPASWTVEQAREAYAIDHWSDGLVDVDANGRLCICLPDQAPVALADVLTAAHQQDVDLPVLLRFPQILSQRASLIKQAFVDALAQHAPEVEYTGVYPIKVNQQRSVVQALVDQAHCGLEVGSKPELLVALALSRPAGILICNGYKDRAYMQLALLGQQMGLQVIIVIEKLEELKLLRSCADAMSVEPCVGVRMRLTSLGAGKWQNSGGERAKFGLHAGQLLALVDELRANNHLHWLRLLHFHMGSQIANLHDIRSGVREAGQYLLALRAQGCQLDYIDIGGGLGVDYEGARSRSLCSMNYTVQQYAECVVGGLASLCKAQGQAMPHLISESGRALTAHHAVLIAPVVAVESMPELRDCYVERFEQQSLAAQLHTQLSHINELPAEELWLEANAVLRQAQDAFVHGEIGLQERADLEGMYFHLLRQIHQRLDLRYRRHRELHEQLQLKLAHKYFINLSVFQSLPDIWALDQVFPIVPLERLNEVPTRHAVLEDLTCDSDGRIEHYVNMGGVEPTLRVHEVLADQTYLLGIFMSGAYQETLGDIHNLFGDTDTADVYIQADGINITRRQKAEQAQDLLHSVGYQQQALLKAYDDKLNAADLSDQAKAQAIKLLQAGLVSSTYLN